VVRTNKLNYLFLINLLTCSFQHGEPAEPAVEPVNLPADLVHNAFKCIHSHLFWAKEAIAEYRKTLATQASAQEARLFFDLMSSLEDIELAEGKPDQIDMSMLDLDDSSKREVNSAAKYELLNSSIQLSLLIANLVRRTGSKRTGRPPSASFRDKSALKTVTSVVGTPGATTTSSASSTTGSSVPFVRQMSEKFNREHQKVQLEAIRQKQQMEEKQKKLAEQKANKQAVRSFICIDKVPNL